METVKWIRYEYRFINEAFEYQGISAIGTGNRGNRPQLDNASGFIGFFSFRADFWPQPPSTRTEIDWRNPSG